MFARTDPSISEENKSDLLRQERDTAFNSSSFSEIGEGGNSRLMFWFDH